MLSNGDIENTTYAFFDIKFIRQDQKQHRNGEACRASPVCFWSSLINLISNATYVVSIYHEFSADLMAKGQRNE